MLLLKVGEFRSGGGDSLFLLLVAGNIGLQFLKLLDFPAQFGKFLLGFAESALEIAIQRSIQRKQHFIFFSTSHACLPPPFFAARFLPLSRYWP